MKTHCLKCKEQTGCVGAGVSQARNGRPMVRSQCASCGCNKCNFMSRERMEGEGLGDFFQKVGQKISKKTLEVAPKTYKNFLSSTSGRRVVEISVCRKALTNALHKVLKLLNRGGYEKFFKSQPYDKLYHLWANITLDNGEVWTIQKNQRLDFKKERRTDGECLKRVKVNRPLTTNQMMTNTEELFKKEHGSLEWYFRYSGLKYNCQQFLDTVLRANGFNQFKQFVLQPLEDLQDDFLSKILQTATDLGGVANFVQRGGEY